MNLDSLPLQIIAAGGISVALLCYVFGMLGDYRKRETKEEKKKFIFDALLFTVVQVAFFASILLFDSEINIILSITFIIFCGWMAFRFKQPKADPVGTGQPMQPARKSENHLKH